MGMAQEFGSAEDLELREMFRVIMMRSIRTKLQESLFMIVFWRFKLFVAAEEHNTF